MLGQTSSEIPIESGVHFFGQNRVDAMGSGSDRCTAIRHRNLERHQGAGVKICLGFSKKCPGIRRKRRPTVRSPQGSMQVRRQAVTDAQERSTIFGSRTLEPGTRSAAPTMGRISRPEATKCFDGTVACKEPVSRCCGSKLPRAAEARLTK